MERSSLFASPGKVTVECIDPSDLFSTFKPLLLKHLPLHNLHWKSANRPLRSIRTLHVDLTKDVTDTASVPERRHQIPGLRRTPYVKIYLLRCDDKEEYKLTYRKQVREWIKSNAQQTESKKATNSQENHDAFEWLIVHVVLPEAPTTAQLRTSKDAQLGTTDSSDSITNKSIWPGRSSSNVLDKLRADFNSSSKSAIDRVAQIRIPKAGQNTPVDNEDQFQDLAEKLKLSILSSFDLRVRQYEEDIREKDSQRSVPGWNFNTFFILKEGLAIGFENVGLFDDALVGYDELSLGLDGIIHAHMEGTGSEHDGRFLPFSDELKDKIQACLKDTDEKTRVNGTPNFDSDSDPAGRLQRRDYPLDTSKRPFRELILSNEISVFDFRLYIFSRQLDLLLRIANAFSVVDQPPDSQSGHTKNEEQFLPLAEACQRAVEFINTGARTLRHDLQLALGMEEPMSHDERIFRGSVISNFILSWTYVSSLQVLTQTSSPNMVLPPAEALPSHMATNIFSPSPSPIKVDGMERSSLSLPGIPSPTRIKGSGSPTWPASDLGRPSGKSTNKTGLEELAGARAELYLLAKAAVQQIGNQHCWMPQWEITKPVGMQDVDLEATEHPNAVSSGEKIRPVINGLQYLDLRNAFQDHVSFKALFECLTTFSYRYSLAGKRSRSAEKEIADLAILKYEAGEYEAAASYLGLIASFYSTSQWVALEATFLEIYADCMKKLGRHGEYVSSLLKLLSRIGGSQQATSTSSVDRLLDDLWSFSGRLTTSISAKFSDFFSISGLGPDIQHYQDKDGFFISMHISFLLGGSVDLHEGVQMTLSSSDSTLPTIKITGGSITVGRFPRRTELSSNLSICGWYTIDSVQVKAGNILFMEDYKVLRLSDLGGPKVRSYASLRFFIYPPVRSFQAAASPASYLHLAQPRSILLEVRTGWNNINLATLTMKCGTAGLRLHLHEAKIHLTDGSEGGLLETPEEKSQAVRLRNCSADSDYRLVIPYTIENADVPIINARLDVDYSTEKGHFAYSGPVTVNTILPISVNVQDIFRENALFSRFTISPATLVPVRLWACHMQGSEDVYTLESHAGVQGGMDVFPKQPANLIYKFTRRQPACVLGRQKGSLTLSIHLSCLDEVVLKAIEKNFVARVIVSPIASLGRPLCAHLLSSLRSLWSAQDLEVIGLCRVIENWPYEALGWESVLTGFNADTRVLARAWLKKWHAEYTVISVYEEMVNERDVPSRLIVIPVEIPNPPVVATASLELDARSTEALTLGEALLAHLQISYTQDWAAKEPSSREDLRLEMSFEVLAPTENWVIGGWRKGYLPAGETARSLPVILLPQRTGHLLLPSIEVKFFKADTLKNGVLPMEGTKVPCEVDIKSLSKCVQVVSGLRETVVEVGVDEAQTQAQANEKKSWLVGSKGREDEL